MEEHRERVVLIGLITNAVTVEQSQEWLEELAFLVETAGGIAVKSFVQRLPMPDNKFYVGSGKLEEIQQYIADNDIQIAVFDDELSAGQLRNIEQTLHCPVLDRTSLILDIFAKRARTTYACTQVELAQYQYLLPRLTRMWTHLERQRGGIGMRGPGETEIETDRRIIRDKIALLRKRLKEIDKQQAVQRGNRGKMVRVALVGYTNVGKSTIMNALSKSEVFAENKLFATLDTTVRKVVIENLPFLLTDTVGFIRKLPTGLIESFKSTLDETREADILLHVVDISHPHFDNHIEVVEQTLADIEAANKPTIMIFNKMDAYPTPLETNDEEEAFVTLEQLKKSWMNRSKYPAIFISALQKENWDELKSVLYQEVRKVHIQRFPFNDFLY
ncbi:MAG: GTPase HflX [Bacteroidales bacterium]|nr:GTPase HflX [Bacteroidales bacterium]